MLFLLCAGDSRKSGYFVYDTQDRVLECVDYSMIERAFHQNIKIYGVKYDSTYDSIVCYRGVMDGAVLGGVINSGKMGNFVYVIFKVTNEDDEFDNTVVVQIYHAESRAVCGTYYIPRVGKTAKVKLNPDERTLNLTISVKSLVPMGEDGRLHTVYDKFCCIFARDRDAYKVSDVIRDVIN